MKILRVILSAAKNLAVLACFASVSAFAAPKSAGAYYGDAAFQYIENRLPTAEITCNEGLQHYPNDQQLQMLLDRIKEAKEEQKNENKKNDPKNDQNNDQNQDQNKDNQDQQNQDQNKDQNSGESSSSAENNQDQQNGGGQSSSSEAGSSDSKGGADQQPQQPENQQSSDSQGNNDQQPDETPAMLSPEEASQLLKDFDEQNGERKPWKPIRGQKRPEKDW
ncbi:MAG: hypothetical protein MJY87_08010 [Fibrobacter sp.]|nr:hypothetical protein [Fibrobacter sp.]